MTKKIKQKIEMPEEYNCFGCRHLEPSYICFYCVNKAATKHGYYGGYNEVTPDILTLCKIHNWRREMPKEHK